MRNLFVPIALAMLASAPAPAQRAISTDLFGIFFEDINFAADGVSSPAVFSHYLCSRNARTYSL